MTVWIKGACCGGDSYAAAAARKREKAAYSVARDQDTAAVVPATATDRHKQQQQQQLRREQILFCKQQTAVVHQQQLIEQTRFYQQQQQQQFLYQQKQQPPGATNSATSSRARITANMSNTAMLENRKIIENYDTVSVVKVNNNNNNINYNSYSKNNNSAQKVESDKKNERISLEELAKTAEAMLEKPKLGIAIADYHPSPYDKVKKSKLNNFFGAKLLDSIVWTCVYSTVISKPLIMKPWNQFSRMTEMNLEVHLFRIKLEFKVLFLIYVCVS